MFGPKSGRRVNRSQESGGRGGGGVGCRGGGKGGGGQVVRGGGGLSSGILQGKRFTNSFPEANVDHNNGADVEVRITRPKPGIKAVRQ